VATIYRDVADPGLTVGQSSPARRRIALFTALLLSGGLLLFPRLPLLAVLILLCFVDRGATLTISRRTLPAWLWLGAVVVLTLVRPGGVDIVATLTRLANFAGGMALLRMYLAAHEGALVGDLRAILPWLSLQAVLTVPFGQFLSALALPLTIADAQYNTFFLVFTWHQFLEGSSVIRPDGLFWEPGVFQVYLNLHLFLSLFIRRDWRQAGLATLAVAATQSTTGLLIAVIQYSAVAWPLLNRGDILQRAVKLILLALVLVPFALFTADNLTDKLVGDARGSSLAREYDLYTGLNIVAAHPLAGIGFDHDRYLALSDQFGFADSGLDPASLADRGSTNGIVQVLYSLGIPLALPFLFALFRNDLVRPRWLIGIILGLSLTSESLAFTPFFCMFAFSGMARRRDSARP